MISSNYNYIAGPQINFDLENDPIVPELPLREYGEPVLELWIEYLYRGGDPHQEASPGQSLILTAFEALASNFFDQELEQFAQLIDLLLNKGADFNSKFKEITVNDHILLNPNCLHVLYAFWKFHEWPNENEAILERIFNKLIENPRLDLRATFSEEFVRGEDPRGGNYPFDLFDDPFGDLLEEANILHYASLIDDTTTIDRLLSRDPDLIHSSCDVVMGKNMLTLHSNYQGIERRSRVTALHLSAQTMHVSSSNFLVGRGEEKLLLPRRSDSLN